MAKKLSRREVIRAGAVLSVLAQMPAFAGESSRPTPEEIPLDSMALTRLGFGARPGDLEAWEKLSLTPQKRLAAWLEEQLKPQLINDKVLEQKITQLNLKTLNKSLTELWKDHVQNKSKDSWELPAQETEITTWMRAVYSQRRLQEVTVSFWHNHFNIYAWYDRIAATFAHFDRDVIRKHVFGNFREMLEDVARAPAMMLFLDNCKTQSGNPNENYPRELFELHTLGAENYLGTRDRDGVPSNDGFASGFVDGDLTEAARCFTGWRLIDDKTTKGAGTFSFFEPWHDRSQKKVLGVSFKENQPPMKDAHDLLDLLARHPGTSRFISRKLCRHFVADDPSDALVARTAKIFHEQHKAPDQLAQVIQSIVLSEEFRDSRGAKILKPFEFMVGFLRATNVDFTPSKQFLNGFESTGQPLFSWRTPDGYPDDGARWLGTSIFFERWRLMNNVLLGKVDGIRANGSSVPQDPKDFVRFLEKERLHRSLSFKSQRELIEFIRRNEKSPNRLSFATAMAFMTPEMQWS